MIRVTNIHESFYNKKNEHIKTESRPFEKEVSCETELQRLRNDIERIFLMCTKENQRIEVYFTTEQMNGKGKIIKEEIPGPEFKSRKPKFKNQL